MNNINNLRPPRFRKTGRAFSTPYTYLYTTHTLTSASVLKINYIPPFSMIPKAPPRSQKPDKTPKPAKRKAQKNFLLLENPNTYNYLKSRKRGA
jgi:hypothetical protein